MKPLDIQKEKEYNMTMIEPDLTERQFNEWKEEWKRFYASCEKFECILACYLKEIPPLLLCEYSEYKQYKAGVYLDICDTVNCCYCKMQSNCEKTDMKTMLPKGVVK